jgi:hypothetical protein
MEKMTTVTAFSVSALVGKYNPPPHFCSFFVLFHCSFTFSVPFSFNNTSLFPLLILFAAVSGPPGAEYTRGGASAQSYYREAGYVQFFR